MSRGSSVVLGIKIIKKVIFAVILLSFLCTFFTSHAQAIPWEEWKKTVEIPINPMSNKGCEILYSLKQTSDGSYIVVGIDYLQTIPDIFIMKVGREGSMSWLQTYDGGGFDEGNSIEETTDGGYIVVGTTTTKANTTKIYLVKTDSSGNKMWDKTIGGEKFDFGYFILQTSDGGFIVSGSTNSTVRGDYDLYLFKIDQLGNIIWERTYGGEDEDGGLFVQQTSDGGYIVTGFTNSTVEGDSEVYVLKTDGEGRIQWEKSFERSMTDVGNAIYETPDGGYVISCNDHKFDETYLVKIDRRGNKLWERSVGKCIAMFGCPIKPTDDGGYISLNIIDDGTKISVLKVDGLGIKQWEKSFTSERYGYHGYVNQTSDGGYIIGTSVFSQQNCFSPMLIKLSPETQRDKKQSVPGFELIVTVSALFTCILLLKNQVKFP